MAPGSASGIAVVVYVAAMAVAAALTARLETLAYTLGFWHYFVYALAFGHRRVPLAALKRDAVILKAASIASLAAVYLTYPIDGASLALVVTGFALNATAAAALGADRTYYGHEIAGLPYERARAFPYSITAHPMLVGNMVAFAGLLLNAPFRVEWWHLAIAHVLANASLVAMESERPGPRGPGPRTLIVMGAALAASIVLPLTAPDAARFPGFAGTAVALAFAWFLHRSYTRPRAKESTHV